MRHARWSLAFACVGVLTAGEALAAQGRSATYAGMVFSDVSGEPVVNVAIAIPARRRSMSTDSAGRFTFADVRAARPRSQSAAWDTSP